MTQKKAIWVRWYPRDALDGMQTLDVYEELAYRRIIDLIYVTGDQLHDDAKALAWSTKLGRRWITVREALIRKGKIVVVDGFVRNVRASSALADVQLFLTEQSRKSALAVTARTLKNKETPSPTGQPTGDPTGPPNQHATINNQQNKENTTEPSPSHLHVSAEADKNEQAYRWAGKVIRLNASDYESWKKAYSAIDLDAELQSRDDWLASQPLTDREHWFRRTSDVLRKRHAEAAKTERTEATRQKRWSI